LNGEDLIATVKVAPGYLATLKGFFQVLLKSNGSLII